MRRTVARGPTEAQPLSTGDPFDGVLTTRAVALSSYRIGRDSVSRSPEVARLPMATNMPVRQY